MSTKLDESKALEHLASAVAHDLNNPLTAIRALAQILVGRLEGEERELAAGILESVGRASRLVESMIDDVRTAAARHQPADVPLAVPVAWAIRQVHRELAEAGGEIELEPLPRVQGNLALLRHLFLNLFVNAVKYRRPGVPPRITVSVRRQDEHWVVAVSDNGRGVDPAAREAVFEPGARLHTDVEGRGIGLAAVRSIAERHGGSAWIEDNAGGGTTVHVALPAAAVDLVHS